jgi:hypothetical protein
MAIEEGPFIITGSSEAYTREVDEIADDRAKVKFIVNTMIYNMKEKNRKVISAILKEHSKSKLEKLQEQLLEEKIALAKEQRQALANKNYMLNTEEGALQRGYLNSIAKAGYIPTPAVEGEEYSAF